MERTLAILKPDCLRRRLVGEVVNRIEQAGFRILAAKLVWLTREQAEAFYAVHQGKPFFADLVQFMTSGPCLPLALEKDNAVADFRALIGATDPAQADPGTIRADLAESKTFNVVHGSDSPQNGRLEVGFFFSEGEIVNNVR